MNVNAVRQGNLGVQIQATPGECSSLLSGSDPERKQPEKDVEAETADHACGRLMNVFVHSKVNSAHMPLPW